ncbi:MAG: formylmethanofuran dehydrogenase subunit E family protein [Desulfuromonadaceae bacterium]|nr:formylmethanofuran dehydrogenase subunit E family protein [Desulfuromonadaceae bacterium]
MKTGYCRILPCVVFAGVMSLTISCSNALASNDSKPMPALFSQLEAFHGHVCAGSIFGARIGLAAKEALKRAGGTGKFVAQYYDLSCPVDGVQVGAGTTYGNAALAVEDRDEHRLVLTAEGNKRKVEARLTKKAEELGLKSRDLGKKAKALPAGSPERVQFEREIEEIFSWLKTAPDEEVVVVTLLNNPKGTR